MPPSAIYALEVSFVDENNEQRIIRLDITGMPQLRVGDEFNITSGEHTFESSNELINIVHIKRGIIKYVRHQLIQLKLAPTTYRWTLMTYVELIDNA